MSNPGGSQVSRKPKILIACFDGTAGLYNAANTNVVKFVSLLKKDTDSQLCYYQAGVGTYFSPGVVSPMFTWLAKILDEAFAWYLDAHVMEGYRFLMDNYLPGDKICLFGFSRGAYTARALAGMLYKVGLLPKSDLQQISFAYDAYKTTGVQADALAAGFKQTFSRDVKVEFVGVWETVQSTGVLWSQTLPFADSNSLIKTFRQALALDEHRVKFLPELYRRPHTDAPDPDFVEMSRLSEIVTALEDNVSDEIGSLQNKLPRGMKRAKKFAGKKMFQGLKRGFTKTILRQQSTIEIVIDKPGETTVVKDQTSVEVLDIPDTEPTLPTDVMEVWFSGCHSDIGGGSVENSVKVSLGQITLRWMVEQVILSNCGIVFDEEALERVSMPLSSFPTSPTPPATEEPTGKSQLMMDNPRLSAVSIDVVSSFVETVPSPAPSSSPTGPPTTPSPSNPETCDALAPLFDQLQLQKAWWLLEILPLPCAWQDAHGKWHKRWRFHLGKGRVIPYRHPKFHSSVEERMDYIPLKYKPRAIYLHDQVAYV
ncbi:uncharacterized protein F5891DRAFT_1002156 [Suillus fuscotomentosus]|uniref:T6SS Phospholipase effector Tle1-like catalytic domain-containing protein n=1 Tax=Suillus fuscotomentosus TaxID=1912939 RepID=A0AAD4EHM7_9AGAM|nr:uncharacterized protein F5891DRAFT_1002156 [Suillus fuscotomentosus]KAG1906398.1 hypothetical protein F5891DRAFT_1002156 [Suillus fuscotomentosus]